MAFSEEIVGCGADFGELVDFGALRQGIAETGQGGAAGDGDGGDGAVEEVRGGGGVAVGKWIREGG